MLRRHSKQVSQLISNFPFRLPGETCKSSSEARPVGMPNVFWDIKGLFLTGKKSWGGGREGEERKYYSLGKARRQIFQESVLICP